MAAAERYAEGRAGTISFAVVDEAGRLHGHDARAIAPSASVLKAMLLVAYLRRDDVRDRALEQWERDLLAPMIRRSDNAAATRMVALVGEARLNALARVAGMEHFRLHWPIWGQSEITPRGQALFFARIDHLVPATHRRYAMHLLATVIPAQRWGVGRVPHAGWRLYFKGGWGSGTGLVDHQVALYRADGERFSLALFTRFDPDHEYGKETLRGLAARLLQRVAVPGPRIPAAGRAAPNGRALVTAGPRCEAVTIRPEDGGKRTYATGADSCVGFQLTSAGARALWSWTEGGESHLSAGDVASPAVVDLGDFDSSDQLGALAGSGELLAYAHGNAVSTVGGPDCPASADALAAGGGRIAAASGSTIEIVDPSTCAVEGTLHAAGVVTGIALDGGLLASLCAGLCGADLARMVPAFDARAARKAGGRRHDAAAPRDPLAVDPVPLHARAAGARDRFEAHLDRVAPAEGPARRAAARPTDRVGRERSGEGPDLDASPSGGRLSFLSCGGSSFGTKRRASTPSSSSTTSSSRSRPAGRGCSPDVDADEVARLARAMTWKFAVCGVRYAGAKAGIRFDGGDRAPSSPPTGGR